MRSFTIHSRLILLVLATALPLTFFAVGLVLWQSSTQQDLLREDAARTAAVAMQAVDRELSGAITGLQVLAASPSIAHQDFQTFHAQAMAAVGIAGNSVIILYDRDGNRIISTAAPFGVKLPQRRDMSKFEPPFQTRKPLVTPLFLSETVKQPTVGVVVPVFVGGEVRYVLGAGLLSQRLSTLLSSSGLPEDWVAALLDQQGTIIARTKNPNEFVGTSSRPEVWQRIQELKRPAGTVEGVTKEGGAAQLSFARSDSTGWTTVIAIPAPLLQGALRQSLSAVAVAAAVVLALASLLAWWAARRISLPASRLQEVAKALEDGREVRLTSTGIAEFDRLAASMEHAGQKILERGARLKESFEQLQDANLRLRHEQSNKDQFIATLAHELRNPLAPIRTGVQILARSPPPQVASKTLAMMDRQVSHLVRLIDDLLDVSRIARGKLVLQKAEVSLQEVISNAIEATEPVLNAAGQKLVVDLPDVPVTVDADRDRLAQVLTNVLGNASKFSGAGDSILLSLTSNGGEAEIRIADRGIGIAPDKLDQIFEPFMQIDDGQNHGRKGGLGIGLWLSKFLVEMHGGTVQARSEGAGYGVTVVIRLPGASNEAGTSSVVPLHRPHGSSALRLLVVDDNRDAADALATVLRMAGHSAQTSNDGATALRLAAETQFDVFLLDIGMPQMDGHELCRRLRQDPRYRNVKIIALTGWGAEADRRRSSDAGFDAHLTKPADWSAIEELLDKPRSAAAASVSGA